MHVSAIVGICGGMLIAWSLIVIGRLSMLLKCSAHLSKQASLSVRSVLLSTLISRGGSRTFLAIKESKLQNVFFFCQACHNHSIFEFDEKIIFKSFAKSH